MAQPLPFSSIEALIEGGVSGQVAVGNQNVQIHADHGAVVFLTPPGAQPAPRLRPLPILQRPRPARGLVDRQADISSALAAIRTALPVGIHGAPGIGKSTLLRHLAYAVETGTPPDGVIHLSARQQPAEDVLQSLFEAFYECDAPCKPTAVQARQLLQGRKALVLLDDAEVGREGAEELLDSAPGCAFVLATREQCLWGDCQAIGLGGLPAEDARALFERELGRPLTADEAPAFASLYARLEGFPLRVLQAAAEVREGRSIAEPALTDEAPGLQSLAALTEEQQRILSALAAVGGGPVGAAHVAVLADVADPLPALDALLARRLVQSHSPRYSLPGTLPDSLAQTLDLTPWRERALGYFADWAEAHHNEPAALLEEAGVLRRLLDWAAENGRHAEARRLGRALDTALAVAGRWGAWEQTLERVRGAAKALGDRTTEGWALHQLGTRRLCLEDKPTARRLLGEALAIREALGDRAGAAVTRHNLGLLGAPPPAEPSGKTGVRPFLRLLPWLAIAVVVLIGIRLAWPLLPHLFRAESSTEKEIPERSDFTPEVSADLTSEMIETTTPLTTDEAPETTDTEIGGEPILEVRRRVTFPTMELGSSSNSQIEVISVTNGGSIPLQVAGVSFTENPGQVFTRSSGCEHVPLPSGESCLVSVLFHPAKAGKYRAVLVVDAEGLERRLVEVLGEAKEPAQREGWCCAGGNISSGSRDDCKARGGRYFDDQKAARTACQPPGGCCVSGNFKEGVSEKECAAVKGGLYMTVAEAPSRCQPPVWCCANGNISSGSREDCKALGGRYFDDPKEARTACQPPGGCCVSGNFKEGVSEKDCTAVKGGLYMTVKEAHSRCQPPVWCCADGKVSLESKDDCNARRGKYFDNQKDAAIACQPPRVWCCADGKVSLESKDDCNARRGRYFDNQKDAAIACQPPPVWCCADGKVSLESKDDCNARRGRYFDNQKDAAIACQPPRVWCCLPGGGPFRTTLEKCKGQEGSRYFETEKEALRNCKPVG